MAAARDLGVRIRLVGPEGKVRKELGRFPGVPGGVEVVDAPEVIEMHESPALALRRKRRASIVVAMDQVRDGHADAVVSAGHTGAAMGAALLRLGTIPGIDRPAVAAVMPTLANHPTVLLDVGANVDSRPANLQQFALMGAVYAHLVLGITAPRVGVLSNGSEEGKGNDLTIRTAALLRASGLNFTGNVEARDFFSGDADVVVCDGFVGNVMLKFGEGFAFAIRTIVKAELAGWQGKLLRLYMSPLVGKILRLYRRVDYREYGGAPLLGINGVCVVAHGSSNARAIRNAIRVATDGATQGYVAEIRAQMPLMERASAAVLGVSTGGAGEEDRG